MKIRIHEPVAGRHWTYPAGEFDVPETIAKRLLDAGTAEKVSKGSRQKKSEVTDGGSDNVDDSTE